MAPLVTEKSCLSCHSHQGYREGDVRGGISVTSSATETAGKIRESQVFLVSSAVIIILLILMIIYFVARTFIKDLQTAEAKLVSLATRDFLTGLLNRREIYRRMEEELQRARRTNSPSSPSTRMPWLDFFFSPCGLIFSKSCDISGGVAFCTSFL